jgi:phage shock protein PspC (stress-responsive transcriptional regulator)
MVVMKDEPPPDTAAPGDDAPRDAAPSDADPTAGPTAERAADPAADPAAGPTGDPAAEPTDPTHPTDPFAEPAGATRADAGLEDGTVAAGSDAEDDLAPRPRLLRGRDHKMLAGVCDGAGRYFDIDPVIFRVVLAVLSLTGGIGLIIYGMGWLIVPQEGERQSEAHRLLSGRIEGPPLIAVLMTLVGCGLYASMLGNGANQAFSLILLAATAGAVYWSMLRRSGGLDSEATAAAAAVMVDVPPAAQAPPSPGGTPSWWRDPLAKDGPGYLWGPDDGPYGDIDRRQWKERKKAVRRERSWPLSVTAFLLAGTAAAVGAGVSAQYQSPTAATEIGLAGALSVYGLAFVIASFAGRARGGTVFMSLLILAGLVGAASLPKDEAGWTSTWRPADAAAVQPTYLRGAGSGNLDLTALDLNGGTVSTHLKVRVGEAVVKLPPDLTLNVTYHVAVGDVLLSDHSHSGVDLKNDREEKPLMLTPLNGARSTGTVNLRVDVGVGDLRVTR